jgi:3-oxoacyl-[acyl-carrier-protein] synthase II
MDITAWSAISPYGLDRSCFTGGIRSGRSAMRWTDPAGPAAARACLVPGFDQRDVLGRKGTKGMDRMTGLAVHAVGSVHASGPADAAVVLGSTAGSVRSMMDFTRASLTGERPFDVDPATIPSVVMNTPAGHCAMWHGITGPNATIASGRVAGLLGLSYARRLLRTGRARTVLCGAAEEYSAARAWLWHHCGYGGGPLGEGAAVLRLEPAGASGAIGTVLGLDSRLGTVTAVAESALRRAGITAGDLWAVIPSAPAERDELAGVFGAEVLDRVPRVAELIGDTGSVSAVFQIAAALAVGGGEPGPRVALVTCADAMGTTAAAVLRLHGTGGPC